MAHKDTEPNPAAVALQKLFMQKTTPEQRKEIARRAGQASGKARRKKKAERNGR